MYPIDEATFVKAYLSRIHNITEANRHYAAALVQALNSAYKQGLKDGKGQKSVHTIS